MGKPELDDTAILTAIGWNIYQRRMSKDLSQTDLAQVAGMNRSFLNGLENGKRNPSVLTLIRLAAVLGTTAADLITITDQ
jgi:transcriptional regulator with XRE-family HTH domain